MSALGLPILIVEDDQATCELERRALSRAGLTVRTVASVADAIATLRSGRFAAVVLDYQLPDGDPWSVVAAAQALTPRVPVVIVTAMGNELVAAEALAHGVAEYLPKADAFWNQLPHVVERVTKIAEADARLRRSDVLFRLIADRSTDLITTVDLNGVIRDVSNAVTNMLGYDPAELIGKQSLDYMHPEDRARITELFTAHKDQTRSTYRQLRRDGTYAWVEVSSSMVYDEASGAPQEVVGVIRDVTERKLAEDKLQTFLDGSPEALVIVDHAGMIALVNARTEQLFGYSRAELLDRPADLLLVQGLRSDAPWGARSAALQANDQSGGIRELACRRKDGSEFPAELSLNRLETQGEWLIACAFVDTTQRKTIQDQDVLLRLGHELPRFEDVDSLVSHETKTIGEYLAVDGCLFIEIDVARGATIAHRDYSRFGKSVSGTYPMSALTPKVREELESGKVVSIVDTKLDPRTNEVYARYVDRDIGSMAAVPLMRDNVWLGAIFVHAVRPRAWAAREIQMLQALAERTWLWMENVRVLRALRDSEGKYRRFIETTHEGVWEIDVQAKTTFVNPRMAEMLGYSVADMLGRGLDTFMDDEGRAQLARDVDRRKAGIAESHDFKFVRRDGSALWARLEVSPLSDEHGEYIGSLAMVADITERKQTEQDKQFLLGLAEVLTVTNDVEAAKRAAASRLGAHLEIDRGCFADIELGSRNMVVRSEWQRAPGGPSMVGEHPLQLLGPLLHDLATGRTVIVNEGSKDPRTAGIHGRSVVGNGVEGVLIVPAHKEGRWVSCLALFSAKPHAWTRREASLAHSTMERTWLCVERLQHIAVLRDFNRDLEQRVEVRTRELKAALNEKEVLLKEIHHRVKNNLQVISSMLNLQAMHMPDGIGRAMFAESQGRVQSIALVHEALYRSKDLSSVNFVEYLQSLVNSVFHAQSAPGRHIEATVDSDDVHLAVAVAIPCGLIVNELVTNALKHAFPDGRAGKIKVGLRRTDDEQVELSVKDDGIGMANGVKASGANTSLGLDLIYTFAEQLEAKVETSTTQGTEFRLTFRDRAE